MIERTFSRLFGVFAQKQTFLNLVYLLAGFVCGLMNLIIFSVSGALVLGLVTIPAWLISSFSLDPGATLKAIAVLLGGLLVIPASLLLWFFPALLEQKLAAWLLNVRFSVTAAWTAAGSPPAALAKYMVSRAAWSRLLFGVIRIPLGLLSSMAVLVGLLVAGALVSMPVVYLAGFHDLIIGKWRIGSLEASLAVFLVALVLAPLATHALNWLSRFSGGLARVCLQD